MKMGCLILGIALLPVGWLLAALDLGMVGHMAGHMIAVAVAAPFIALGLADSRADIASLAPRLVKPMTMMLVELMAVWAWHLPWLRHFSHAYGAVMMAEQMSFLAAGVLLWSAVIHTSNRAAGIGALLLTSMHMTLLGVLVGLAPRPLYTMPHHLVHGLSPLEDQQLGAVIMLVIGAASYLIGGLALLAGFLRDGEGRTA